MITATTYKDLLHLFRETDRKFKETGRKFQETERLLRILPDSH